MRGEEIPGFKVAPEIDPLSREINNLGLRDHELDACAEAQYVLAKTFANEILSAGRIATDIQIGLGYPGLNLGTEYLRIRVNTDDRDFSGLDIRPIHPDDLGNIYGIKSEV